MMFYSPSTFFPLIQILLALELLTQVGASSAVLRDDKFVGAPQFAVVVDVGSTGSRVHVFEYRYNRGGCNGQGQVRLSLPEMTRKIRPGLSTYLETHLQQAAASASTVTRDLIVSKYLKKIRQQIDALIVNSHRSKTPIFLFGTGGLRHYSPEELKSILESVRQIVRTQWTDYKTNGDWIDALDGEREGLFSWFVLNQLLGRQLDPNFQDAVIDPSPYRELKGKPVALIELGGASAQVVVQLSSQVQSDMLPNASFLMRRSASDAGAGASVQLVQDHPGLAVLNFCNTSRIVFVKSFQGFGRQLALQRFLASRLSSNASFLPCLPSDVVFPKLQLEAQAAIEDIGETDDGDAVGTKGIREGTFELCKKALDDSLFGPLGNFTAASGLPFSLEQDVDIVGTENFYHFHKMVSHPSPQAPYKFSIASLYTRAQELCQLKSVFDIASRLNPNAEFEKAKTACFGLTFLGEFLEQVLRLPYDREIEAISTVRNISVSWPAGHLLLELPRLILHYPDIAPTTVSLPSRGRNEL